MEPTNFDHIIQEIGNDGPFQRRFNILYNFVLVALAAMPHLNIIFALAVPNHWCHVPGRELTNFTIEEWKDVHIPKTSDARGIFTYDKCNMFDIAANSTITGCQFGWDYDKTWYSLTVASQENWVCDKQLHVTNTFALSRIGEVIGTLVFGHYADAYGRKPVFYATVITLLTGKIIFSASASWIYIFFIGTFMANLPSTAIFQGPLIIAMEVSKTEKRAHIAMMQCIGWTMGLAIMPFIMWLVRRWDVFILATSLPLGIFLFTRKSMIESPRWLATQCKTKRCIKELQKICDVNKTTLPPNIVALLKKAEHTDEAGTHYSILGLFSSWRLSKNTVIVIISWSILLLIYSTLTLNIDNLGGNPFLNFLFQSLSELPAYIIGKYISDYFGRRWTTLLSFVLATMGCIPIIFIINDQNLYSIVAGISIFIKFSVSLAFYSVNLQALEIYPTCLRQTGISVGTIFGATLGILAPYVVYMGVNHNATYPYILLSTLAAFAAICCVFLPETLNKKLPETLAEASNFGADQNIWGRTKEQYNSVVDDVEKPLKR